MAEELTDAEVDEMLERFDQTDPKLQRRIIVRFIERAAYFNLAVEAIAAAPVTSGGGDDHERLAREYAGWHEQYVASGPLTEPPGSASKDEPAKKPRKKRAKLSDKKCAYCTVNQAVADDRHGRCGSADCQGMVPDKRGGWRQLGMYDG